MIKPVKTSHQLRVLADALEQGEAPEFALIVLHPDGDVARAVRHGKDFKPLIGAMEELKLDILTGEIE